MNILCKIRSVRGKKLRNSIAHALKTSVRAPYLLTYRVCKLLRRTLKFGQCVILYECRCSSERFLLELQAYAFWKATYDCVDTYYPFPCAIY